MRIKRYGLSVFLQQKITNCQTPKMIGHCRPRLISLQACSCHSFQPGNIWQKFIPSHWQAESSPKHASNASIQQGQVHPAVNSLNKNVLMIKVVLYFLFSIYSCQHLQSLKMSEISSYLHISFTLNLIYKQILLARSLDKSKANDQPSAHMPWSHCCSLKSQFVSFRKKVSGWFSGFWWTFELPFYTMLCWWFVDDFLKIIFCAVHHNLWLMVDDFPSHPSSKTLSFQAHFIRLNALAEHLLLRVIT